MKYRQLGNTDLKISELSFGTWAIGGSWGQTNDQESLKALEVAMENGVNFLIRLMFTGMDTVRSYLRKRLREKKILFILQLNFVEVVISIHQTPTRLIRYEHIVKIV